MGPKALLCIGLFLLGCTTSLAADEGKAHEGGHKKHAHRVLAYYSSWSIYVREYMPMDIPYDSLTHLNYAFANVVNGECVVGDSYADLEKAFAGDNWRQQMQGNFHQINNVTKTASPHLKTIISVGGWRWSKHFSDIAAAKHKRKIFINSCVDFMVTYGFDGIDIDWEFPVEGGLPDNAYRKSDGKNYLLLLKEFRSAMDSAGDDYLLSIASPAGYEKYAHLDLGEMSKYLDFYNIMSYDYNACWGAMVGNNRTSHHTPLYYNDKDPIENDIYYNCDYTIEDFLDAGVPPSKISIGVAFYGRGYQGVTTGSDDGTEDPETPFLFQEFVDCPMGTWDNWETGHTGTYDYSDIEKKLNAGDWTRYWDPHSQAPYIVKEDPIDNILISYDDADSMLAKTQYALANKLGGVFLWSLDGDPTGVLLNQLYSFASAEAEHQQEINRKQEIHLPNQKMITNALANAKSKEGEVDTSDPANAQLARLVAQQKKVEEDMIKRNGGTVPSDDDSGGKKKGKKHHKGKKHGGGAEPENKVAVNPALAAQQAQLAHLVEQQNAMSASMFA